MSTGKFNQIIIIARSAVCSGLRFIAWHRRQKKFCAESVFNKNKIEAKNC